VKSPIRQRQLAPVAVSLLAAALCPAAALAGTYGTLIVRHNAAASAALETRFDRVRPPQSFLLVVSEPSKAPLKFKWSVRCSSSTHKESGGASGEAVVASGHWVKRVRANWIKHPISCSGSIDGSAAGSPVLVRVFAD
jgi:hypothetical protein